MAVHLYRMFVSADKMTPSSPGAGMQRREFIRSGLKSDIARGPKKVPNADIERSMPYPRTTR
jgi:hypothetical protein